jgi:membrane protein implicated in regulation of membrane protease activity
MILLLAIIVVFLFQVSGTAALVLLVVACCFEAVELWALRRWSKRLDRKHPAVGPEDQLVGMTGEVVTACHPKGQVRVRGELWEAVCPAGADVGARVKVQSVDALTVNVEPAVKERYEIVS